MSIFTSECCRCFNVQSFSYAGVQTPSFKVDCSVPEGSVLGPRCFISYTEDIVDVLERHAVRSHLYADDTQFYDSCRLDDTMALRSRLSCCTDKINLWCKSRRLQLNASKTELIWFGSQSNLAKLSRTDLHNPSRVIYDPTVHCRP